MKVKLIKMNGLGNDFLIFDEFEMEYNFSSDEIIKLSSRDNKITGGCDQFIILKKPATNNEDGIMEIYNSDGSEVSACGNATRCIGLILTEKLKKNIVNIRTKADLLASEKISENEVSVNMGKPRFLWNEIPLAKNISNFDLPIKLNDFALPSAVSMGNPHLVFFTDIDIKKLDVKKIGAPLEVHELFPEKTNVSFAKILDENNIEVRVFERGVGETKACGTAACAVAVLAIEKKLTNHKNINIHMLGGILKIRYDKNDVIMTGAVEKERIIEV